MKRTVLYVVCALVLAGVSSSCKKKEDVIPRATMSKIYAELFVVDSWLSMSSPEDRNMADTTAFYEPVFKKFGYTTSDYLASVEYYLNDPERFSRILKKTRAMLNSDLKELDALLQQEQEKENAERARRSRLEGFSAPYIVYRDFVKKAFFTDRVQMELDENGVYVPSSNQEEISYRGPKLVFQSDSIEVMELDKPLVPEVKSKLRILSR